MHLLVWTTLCLTLMGCEMQLPVPQPHVVRPVGPMPISPTPPDRVGTCGAEGLRAYLGHPATDLPASGPWSSLRVIRPGMAVTMDYTETRLNARTDSAGIIIDLTCG